MRKTEAVPNEQHLVAIGGSGVGGVAGDALDEYVLGLSADPRPRVLLVPTGWGDDAGAVLQVYDAMRTRAELSHLFLFERTVADLRSFVLGHDIVWVAGGNAASMLGVWRAHGVDVVLREAWERGVVLTGASAGALCWFEDGVTRSFGPELTRLGDGLAFLAGSFCAHYDGPGERRAAYRRLVAEGFLQPGLAADDRVGVHFVGSELREVVSARPHAKAYRVEPGNGDVAERELATRVLA